MNSEAKKLLDKIKSDKISLKKCVTKCKQLKTFYEVIFYIVFEVVECPVKYLKSMRPEILGFYPFLLEAVKRNRKDVIIFCGETRKIINRDDYWVEHINNIEIYKLCEKYFSSYLHRNYEALLRRIIFRKDNEFFNYIYSKNKNTIRFNIFVKSLFKENLNNYYVFDKLLKNYSKYFKPRSLKTSDKNIFDLILSKNMGEYLDIFSLPVEWVRSHAEELKLKNFLLSDRFNKISRLMLISFFDTEKGTNFFLEKMEDITISKNYLKFNLNILNFYFPYFLPESIKHQNKLIETIKNSYLPQKIIYNRETKIWINY